MSALSDFLPGLRVQPPGGDGALVLEGELDLSTVPGLRSVFERHRPIAGDVTLDISGLRFIDSTGLQELLDLSATLTDGAIVLRNVSAYVLKLLRVTGLDRSDRIRVEATGSIR
jgi:anti-anti-sigma factor